MPRRLKTLAAIALAATSALPANGAFAQNAPLQNVGPAPQKIGPLPLSAATGLPDRRHARTKAGRNHRWRHYWWNCWCHRRAYHSQTPLGLSPRRPDKNP